MSHTKPKTYYSGHSTVSANKVRELPQPIRIAQLLGLPQNNTKNLVPISLPERLTPYLRSSRKKAAANAHAKVPCEKNNVRRNLRFTEMQPTMESKNSRKTDVSHIAEMIPTDKETLRMSRKSCLLPPNAIKDKHVQSILKQRMPVPSNVRTKSGSKYLGNFKTSEESCLPLVRDSTARTNSIPISNCGKSNKISVIQYTSSQTLHENDQSGINVLQSPNSDLTDGSGDAVTEPIKHKEIDVSTEENCDTVACNVPNVTSACVIDTQLEAELQHNAEKRTCLPMDIHKDLSVQVVASKVNELCANLHCKDNGEYVILRKAQLTDLASDLKMVICRLEEIVSSLKVTEASIMDALCTDNISKEACETPCTASSKSVGADMFKENNVETRSSRHIASKNNKEDEEMLDSVKRSRSKSTERRRSARLMTKQSSSNLDITNDSFVNLENELRIATSDTAIASAGNYTALMHKDTDNISKESRKIPRIIISTASEADILKGNNVETPSSHHSDSENNKENEEMLDSRPKSAVRRRSARLMAKTLSNLDIANDKFVHLENKLRITKSDAALASAGNYTPVSDKCKVGRPLKEYMALKSRMSCLLTPNIKRFNSIRKSENNTNPESHGVKALLSNKLLIELNNLYADSPDTL